MGKALWVIEQFGYLENNSRSINSYDKWLQTARNKEINAEVVNRKGAGRAADRPISERGVLNLRRWSNLDSEAVQDATVMAPSRTVSLYSDKTLNIVYVIGSDLLIKSDRYGLSYLCAVVHIPFRKRADPLVKLTEICWFALLQSNC